MHRDVCRDGSVGIATRYGLDDPGIESRWGRGFPHPSRPTLEPTQPPVQWVPCLSRGQNRQGVALTTSSLYSAKVKERVELTSTPPLGLRGLLQGEL